VPNQKFKKILVSANTTIILWPLPWTMVTCYGPRSRVLTAVTTHCPHISFSSSTPSLSTSLFLSLNPPLPKLQSSFISSHFYFIFNKNPSFSLNPSISYTNSICFFFFFFKLTSPSLIHHNHPSSLSISSYC